jgi:hypothetical protein
MGRTMGHRPMSSGDNSYRLKIADTVPDLLERRQPDT